jgi:hypothetical protein
MQENAERLVRPDQAYFDDLVFLIVGILVFGRTVRSEKQLIQSNPYLPFDFSYLKALIGLYFLPFVINVLVSFS